jgi:DNA-binding transcriptional LysR family regulator
MVSSEQSPESYDTTPLLTEQLFLVGAADAGLEPAGPVAVSRLAEVALILPGRPNMIRAQVEAAIRATGRTYRGALEAETLSLCLELTRRGLGHTVMPASALHGRIGVDGDLGAAPVDGLELTWSICANRARSHSVAVLSVAAALRGFVAERLGPCYRGPASG